MWPCEHTRVSAHIHMCARDTTCVSSHIWFLLNHKANGSKCIRACANISVHPQTYACLRRTHACFCSMDKHEITNVHTCITGRTHMSMHTWEWFCSHMHVLAHAMCLHVDVLTYPCVCTHTHVCSSPMHTRAFTYACFSSQRGEHENSNGNKCFMPVHTYLCVWKHTRVCVKQQMRPHTCIFLGENETANVHTCITGHTHTHVYAHVEFLLTHACACTHTCTVAPSYTCIHPCRNNKTCKGQRARAHLRAHTYIYIRQMIWFTHTRPCTRNVFACGRANIPIGVCTHTHVCSSPNTRAFTHACFSSQRGEHENSNGNKCFVPVHTYPCVWKHTHVCIKQQMRLQTCMFLGENETANVHTCITGHTHTRVYAHVEFLLTHACACTHTCTVAPPYTCIHPCRRNKPCKGQRARAHLWAHTTMYIHMKMFMLTHTRPCTRN